MLPNSRALEVDERPLDPRRLARAVTMLRRLNCCSLMPFEPVGMITTCSRLFMASVAVQHRPGRRPAGERRRRVAGGKRGVKVRWETGIFAAAWGIGVSQEWDKSVP